MARLLFLLTTMAASRKWCSLFLWWTAQKVAVAMHSHKPTMSLFAFLDVLRLPAKSARPLTLSVWDSKHQAMEFRQQVSTSNNAFLAQETGKPSRVSLLLRPSLPPQTLLQAQVMNFWLFPTTLSKEKPLIANLTLFTSTRPSVPQQ